jgi:hypothetical protein
VTTPRRLAVSLLVCGLVAHAGAGTGLGAAKPSPKELWKLYPLDPTGRGERERPVTTTEAGRPSPPAPGGVAGKTATVGTQDGSGDDDGGTSVSFALVIGGLVGAILLFSLAALPATAARRLTRWRVDRRRDVALAGALALLVVTLVYLVSVL